MNALRNISRDLRLAVGAATVSSVHAWRRLVRPLDAALARRRRQALDHYVAVIGSCGKSTTTLLSGAIFRDQVPASASLVSNGEFDAIRYLRKLEPSARVFVQELSEFPVGILEGVANLLAPDAAVVTAIGLDHLTEFRTLEGVAAELSKLVSSIPPTGFVCLNADDPVVLGLAPICRGRVVRYGRSAEAEVRAENVSAALPGRLAFDLVIGAARRRVRTRFVGTVMLSNVLGALSVAHAAGLDIDRAVKTIGEVEPLLGRLSALDGINGHHYVLDVVKASLWSTERVIDDLPNMFQGPRILVLGEVSDGQKGSLRYRKVIRRAAPFCDLVIGVGPAARSIDRLKASDPDINVVPAHNLEEIEAILEQRPTSLVLFKGKHLFMNDVGFDRRATLARLTGRPPESFRGLYLNV